MIFFAGKPEFGDAVSNIASIMDEAIDDIVAMGRHANPLTPHSKPSSN